MADDLSVLRAKAEAATPGPWERYDQAADEGFDYELNCIRSLGDPKADWIAEVVYTNADADFIEAASPDVLCRLLDRLERAEGALWEAEAILNGSGGSTDRLLRALHLITAALPERCPDVSSRGIQCGLQAGHRLAHYYTDGPVTAALADGGDRPEPTT